MARSTLPTGQGYFRTDNFPLDATSVADSLSAAVNYGLSDPTAYPGQLISVRTGDNTPSVVVVNEDNTLSVVGSGGGSITAYFRGVYFEQDLASQCGSSNLEFTLAASVDCVIGVYLNGQKLIEGKQYTLTGTPATKVTLATTPPSSTDAVIVCGLNQTDGGGGGGDGSDLEARVAALENELAGIVPLVNEYTSLLGG